MKVLDLFSGIGGFALASHPYGFETAAFCEYDPDCQKLLKKRFPGIPIFSDVRKLTKEDLENEGITDVSVVAGGFPCQPFSVAGEQRGEDDDRHLWPEMLRLIKEIRPRWVIGENVSGLVTLALEDVSLDLESAGYEVRSVIVPAVSKNAWHRRDRVWIIGHKIDAHSNGKSQPNESKHDSEGERIQLDLWDRSCG